MSFDLDASNPLWLFRYIGSICGMSNARNGHFTCKALSMHGPWLVCIEMSLVDIRGLPLIT